jgi:hypothetical protein
MAEPGAARPSGPALFARYALGPNRLGLCGPSDWHALLELGSGPVGTDRERALRDLASGFEGAWPYLRLIAQEAGRADPLDPDVVEAYWLGNGLAAAASPRALHTSLDERFRARTPEHEWSWLESKPAAGAVPVHAFHVLDVLPRAGLVRGDGVTDVLHVMDSCRIRWGEVVGRCDDRLAVATRPLIMVDGRLRLGEPRVETVRYRIDGFGTIADPGPGDIVSLHWDWVCDRLDRRQLGWLVASTERQVALTNQTI